jgi:uncharacterized membrane protein YphA (DoxX/SURF4 family)
MKKFTHFASNAVPLLARILLFLAFLPTGWHHAMDSQVFAGAQAVRLRELGVSSTLTDGSGRALVHLEPAQATNASGDFQARSLHQLTLAFDAKGMPKPYIAAWIVAVFELIGAGLLLIGLFSRVWASGIAFWAIGLFGMEVFRTADWGALWTTNIPDRAAMISLITMATLALWIAFAGAGEFSLDALIFRRGGGGGGGGGDDGE